MRTQRHAMFRGGLSNVIEWGIYVGVRIEKDNRISTPIEKSCQEVWLKRGRELKGIINTAQDLEFHGIEPEIFGGDHIEVWITAIEH